jgi:4-amino-4-deoxy-L-arabinose transferase-like glycosyltransferase
MDRKWRITSAPVTMSLALLALFLLFRRIVGSFGAVLGILIVAASPVTLDLTNTSNSHASTLCFVCWGMLMLIRWWESNGFWRAILAGFLLGYAATIRYTEGLLLLPIGLVILFNFQRGRWRQMITWAQAAVMLLAWALPVVMLLRHNWVGFHHLTGYDPTNESTGFSWEQFQGNWENMLHQLNELALFFVLPFGLLGLALMFWWKRASGRCSGCLVSPQHTPVYRLLLGADRAGS